MGIIFSRLEIRSNLYFCNRFAYGAGDKKRYFSTSLETHIIIAGIFDPKGKKLEQLTHVIHPRIGDFESPDDGINLNNLSFIFEENINTTLETLKERVLSLL